MSPTPTTPAGWDPTEKTIHRTFQTKTWKVGLAFVTAIGELAEAAHHHPDIILSFSAVIVTLMTHDQGMVTSKDTDLATDINQLWDREFAGKE